MHRRSFVKLLTGAAATMACGSLASAPSHASKPSNTPMRTRTIPRTGEALPVIGLGTWQTFDVGTSASERAPLAEVLQRFFAAGGRVIDSSPMYGRAESVVGDLVADAGHPAFLATKVWTEGRAAGEAQMQESLRRLRTERLDLMQVHNLLDWRTHLPVMRAWRDEGRFRYLGITHYTLESLPALAKVLRAEPLDFVQLPYSVGVREAEAELLPLAADQGTAVLVMRPFEEGALFSRVKGRPVPAWATEQGFESWAQLFLAFILAHPAVTCAIPATAKPHHLAQNVKAGSGPELDAASRERLVAELA